MADDWDRQRDITNEGQRAALYYQRKETLTYEQTGHPCFGSRPEGLIDGCKAEGLMNCAGTLAGLLEERAALARILKADAEGDGHEMSHAIRDAAALLRSRGIIR
jgi:hypothetical protein